MDEVKVFTFEGRKISYTFKAAEDVSAPLLVILHGHTENPRPSKFKDPRWNVLCPVDNFGFKGFGSWYLGEDGDLFWLRAMPALISHVYKGNKLFFAGSSMGGFGAILHGTLNNACAVYANVAQTYLLGSTYAAQGMSRYFAPIFGDTPLPEYNDLKNIIFKDLPTTFLISGYRFDKDRYVEEQSFAFIDKLLECNVNFSQELRLGKGHTLTHSVVEISELLLRDYDKIIDNYDEKMKASELKVENSDLALSIPKNKADVGKAILDKGKWYVDRYGFADLNGDLNWEMDPFDNRSWVWLLHQLSFILPLIAHDRQNKTIDGGVWAMKAVRSWWHHNGQPDTAPAHAWHDHGSAKRVENLILLRKHLRPHLGSDPRIIYSDFKLFQTMFETHARFLADEKKYSKGTNHGFEQALALFVLSCDGRNEPWAEAYKKLSLERIQHEISVAFSEDGGHNENSPQYQKYGIWQLLKVETLFQRYKKDLFDKQVSLLEKINEATLALSYMIAPDGKYCPIGDTEAISYPDIFKSDTAPENHPSLLFALSRGEKGSPPKADGIILRKSGWAAFRSGWRGPADLHLLTKCAYNSHYHRQDDDTSFVLNAHGEEWITDGGLYKYVETDPMRIHLRSHFAHSLSSPDEIDPVRRIDEVARRNIIESGEIGPNKSFVQMLSFMFPGYISRRRIELEDMSIRISDTLTPTMKSVTASSCTTRFLVPGDKKISVEGERIRISGKSADLVITTDLRPKKIRVLSGQQEPALRGWQSRTFNTFEPAQSIEIQYAGGELNANYLLIFEK